jgi:hypothetical protein
MVLDEPRFGEKLRKVLEPFAANFSGSLGHGDLVIPEAEVDNLVGEILEAARRASEDEDGVSAHELYAFLAETRRLRSVQEQADRLRSRFRIRHRSR